MIVFGRLFLGNFVLAFIVYLRLISPHFLELGFDFIVVP